MDYRSMLAGVAVLALIGCGTSTDEQPPGEGGGPVSVPEFGGKADNYIVADASEYQLTGMAQTELPDDFASLEGDERERAIDDAVDRRASSIAGALRDYVDSKVEEASDGSSDYFMYARDDNEEVPSREVVDDERVEFEFKWDFVGSPDLIEVMVEEGEGNRSFEVEVGSENPTTLTVDVAPSPSDDAFPKYDELFADGVYDIGLHFGGDYNDERYDIEMAKWAVDKLLAEDWSNPEVDSYEDLTIDSPPFTKQMTIEGEQIEARVYIYHPEMPKDGPQEKLTEKMKESFEKRDVVLYNGHAGPDAGFILDYQPRHEIEPDEFDELPMRENYQIVVINGCETYDSYVPDLMENDRKTFENIDIVTTVHKTPISSFDDVTYKFLEWMTYTDKQGRHFPMTWNTILQGVNKGGQADAHYGVHGIDQDPELNPHRSEGIACRSCSSQGQCQAGGNYCLRLRGGNGCGVACATDEACGEGANCVPITDDSDKFYIPRQCVPKNRQCGG